MLLGLFFFFFFNWNPVVEPLPVSTYISSNTP